MRLAVVIVALLVSALSLAPDAPAAPVIISQLFVTLDASRSSGDLLAVASKGCIGLGPFQWAEKKSAHMIEWSGSSTLVSGKVDFGARSGTAAGGGGALVAQATSSRPLTVGQIGIELSGSSAYVVGSLNTGQAKGPRVKLLRIAPAVLKQGPLTDKKHQPIPNSLYVQVSGRASVASGLAAVFNRIRCKRGGSRAIRVGLPVGTVTAQLFPDGAASTSGSVELVNPAGVTEDNGQSIAFGAVAPATAAASGSAVTLSFPTTAGTTLGLTCDAGVRCILQNGHANLGGGFTMAAHGVTETFTGLELDYSGPVSVPTVNITATLNGAPVTLSNTSDLTLAGDVAANLTTAFGAQVDVALGRLAVQSTSLHTP
jgi:hypothetical protein